MIINLRGTSGSGKTHIVRQVMALYGGKARIMQEGRKQPIAYIMTPKQGSTAKPLAIMGHYETACGGCDTIKTLDEVYANVRQAADQGYDVLYEGLLVSGEIRRAQELHRDYHPQVLFIGLDTTLEKCVESINQRRWAKDPEKPPVNPRNTAAKHKCCVRGIQIFQEQNIPAEWHNRESAFERIREVLGHV